MRLDPGGAVAARAHVQRGGQSGVDWLARLGLAARGIVYLLVAWLAVRIAFHHAGQQADRQGALREVAQHPAGKAVLAAMAVGFAGYALWRVTQVISGFPDESGAKDLGKRAVSAGRALIYFGIAYSTARLLWSGQSSGGSDSTSKKATGGALAHSGGRALVIAVGVGFVIGGLVLAIRAIMRKFEKHLKMAEMSPRTRKTVGVLGAAGQTARGIVFGMIGGFLIQAAVTFDPHKARGLDDSLRALAHGGWGRAALVAVALGLAAFGAFSLAEARYRKT